MKQLIQFVEDDLFFVRDKNAFYVIKNNAPVNVSNSESFDHQINKMLYASEGGSLVSLPDGSVKSIKISPRLLYDKYGNELKYLKQDFGNGEINGFKDSKHKLQCIDGKLQLIFGTAPSANVLSILGRQEEQSISISNIIQINEP